MTRAVKAGPTDRDTEEIRTVERVGAVVRRLRADAGLSLREVADRAGMSAMQLSRVEKLESSPTEEKITGLAHALGVDPRYLFGDKDTISTEALNRRTDALRQIVAEYRYLIDECRYRADLAERAAEEARERERQRLDELYDAIAAYLRSPATPAVPSTIRARPSAIAPRAQSAMHRRAQKKKEALALSSVLTQDKQREPAPQLAGVAE